MTVGPKKAPRLAEADAGARSWPDDRLVRECLNGNEDAWHALIQKYKRLIYSIPLKYRASPEDAADIFQAVCLELFSELPNLRKVESLTSWIITVASHKSYHWKKQQRMTDLNLDGVDAQTAEELLPTLAPEVIEDLERQQMVRDAIAKLPARCAEMVRLLFYEHPPVPYSDVAKRLGLAVGSIGFIRGRCLKRLQKILADMGF
ncbi:MAG: RNA polymerase sigma factor [Terriglobales bacterium]